jgi:hypothetical protein
MRTKCHSENLKGRDHLRDQTWIEKMALKVMCESFKWIQVAQDKYQCRCLLSTVTNLRVSLKSESLLNNFSGTPPHEAYYLVTANNKRIVETCIKWNEETIKHSIFLERGKLKKKSH